MNYWVIYESMDIPTSYANSEEANNKYSQLSLEARQGISLCRLKQFPVSEILKLWNDGGEDAGENLILSLNLHPLQKNISEHQLSKGLLNTVIECVNDVGVDINEVLQNEELQSVFQFVSGLGPI